MLHVPRTDGRKLRTTALAVLVIVGAAAGPATARDDRSGATAARTASTGDINPTNIAVVETDFCGMVTTLPPEVQMRATEAHAYATGAGVLVAVLDGGFNLAHPDLAGHVAKGWDTVDGDANPNDLGNGVDDDHDGIVDRGVGHGTFVAGMVLKIAPGATIVPIRVRNDEGHGTNVQVVRGITQAIMRRVHVINLSLEVTNFQDDTVRAALETAAQRGISVVVSAGNDGLTHELTTLAGISGGIAAGAVDSEDRVAPFSNICDIPAVVGAPRFVFAPGVDLYGPIGSPTTDARGTWSGTSFSAGLLAGAVAVVRQARPGLLPADLADLVARTSDPVTDAWGMQLLWAGRANVLRAVTE